MSKRLSSIYFYTDSDLFELFEPEKRRLKMDTLLKIARSKGIVLSKEDDRDEICGYLARLNWSWVEIERLCSYIESPQRSKKETSFRVETETEIGPNSLEEYVEKTKVSRIEKYDEDWTFTKKSNGDLKVVVQHPEIDLKKSKVRQMKDEELVIEISHSPEGFSIRHTASERAEKISKAIVDSYSESLDKAPKTKKISLSFIADREGRTKFFIELMQGIPGFDLLGGASKIGVARQISTESSSFSNVDDEMSGVEEENAEALGVVNKAFFEGSSVTESPEYELAKKNSFIYRAVWMVKNTGGAGEKIELEALFRDPTSGNGFEYQVKGIYPVKIGNDYRKTSQKPKPSEKRRILDLIELTAHNVISQLTDEYKMEGERSNDLKMNSN